MNAIVQLSPAARKSAAAEPGLPIGVPANDDAFSAVGAIFGPEEPLNVSFIGLDATAIARALASFPGGRRYLVSH